MSPYIKQERRSKVKLDSDFKTPGELNYFITRAILDYLEDAKGVIPSFGNIPARSLPNRYRDYNEVIGVLELVKLELWHRLICPYEKKKREKNGDVYEED